MIDSETPLNASSRVILYTRQNCHLCEDAKLLLEAQGLVVESVDIDANPDLRARYDTWVPVVEIDGRIRFKGKVDPLLLRRIIGR